MFYYIVRVWINLQKSKINESELVQITLLKLKFSAIVPLLVFSQIVFGRKRLIAHSTPYGKIAVALCNVIRERLFAR